MILFSLCSLFNLIIDFSFKSRIMVIKTAFTRCFRIKPYDYSFCSSACFLVPIWRNGHHPIRAGGQKSNDNQQTPRSADYTSMLCIVGTYNICKCAGSWTCLSPLLLMILYLISSNRATRNLPTHIHHNIPKVRSH